LANPIFCLTFVKKVKTKIFLLLLALHGLVGILLHKFTPEKPVKVKSEKHAKLITTKKPIKGTEIPQALIPESFKVLVKELQSLGIEVIPMGVKEVNEEEVKEESSTETAAIEAAKEALGVGEVGVDSELNAETGPMEVLDAQGEPETKKEAVEAQEEDAGLVDADAENDDNSEAQAADLAAQAMEKEGGEEDE
jgi:DNA-directed RNA polymerase subunit beta